MSLKELADSIRSFPGVTRKNDIEEVVDRFPTSGYPQVFAAAGEDAAAIDVGDRYVLFATDGIMESLVKADPFLAGYFSVLVNVNDIAAMGGRPLGMVDVLSSSPGGPRSAILDGMRAGVEDFDVPIVGGHTHPDCSYDAVDIAIIGSVAKDAVLLSSSAREGDDIVFVFDLDGEYRDHLPLAYITTMSKPKSVVTGQMEAVATIAERHLAHACKDISNPGHLGTLGMMLETSGKGGLVDVTRIPRPEGVDEIRWAETYQGCGFVFSCDPSCSSEIAEVFSEVGCATSVVGKVDGSRSLRITDGSETVVLFDFENEIITGCSSD